MILTLRSCAVKLTFVSLLAAPLFASVTVSSPTNGTISASPVRYAASASSSTCAAGIGSMGIYVNNQLKYVQQGSTLNTSLALSPGTYTSVVQEWDRCGGSSHTAVTLTVSSDHVTVTSPASGSAVASPVTYIADASSLNCSKGIASIGVYVNNSLQYVTSGSHLNTQLPLSSGPKSTVVQAWDNCGGSAHQSVPITVASAAYNAPVKHVFIITLENKGFSETFGANSQAPYLSKTLTGQGQLLTQYYGIGHHSADNYLATISGQAPNPATQYDCSTYKDFSANGQIAADGQIVGQGCVYPASVLTVADQLRSAGLTWHGYMEGMSSACLHPALNASDPYQGANPGGYATKHNPFVYFHSLIDSGSCTANDVPLTQLTHDLGSVASTPNLTYIVPNICHDGHDTPCQDGEPGGLISADAFLKQWVPIILNSPAYQQDGVLIINFDEADADSSGSIDASATSSEMAGPNASLPGIKGPGGGRVGAVVLSRFVVPGTQNATEYNHYALLKSIENFFGFTYLGYAQAGNLTAFGRDVFGNAP